MHCRSDAACLCLSCDRNVHSANALSKRHLRTLLCERCHSQPAITRCIQESTSLCQDCNWSGHAAVPASDVEHKREMINLYSGCPSAADFSRIWSFFSVDKSISNPEPDPMRLEEREESPSRCELSHADCCTEDTGMEIIAPDAVQFDGRGPLDSLNLKVIYDLDIRHYLIFSLKYIRNKVGAFAQHTNGIVGETVPHYTVFENGCLCLSY